MSMEIFNTQEANEDFNVNELIIEIRRRIGQPRNGDMFTEEEVKNFVEETFNYLQEHQRLKLVEAFITDQERTAQLADDEAESTN